MNHGEASLQLYQEEGAELPTLPPYPPMEQALLTHRQRGARWDPFWEALQGPVENQNQNVCTEFCYCLVPFCR